MEPITQSFSGSKKQIMDAFPAALETLDMPLFGRNDELGLISIRRENEPMLYAHIVEQSDDTADVSIAPGKSNLKDQDNSSRPDSTIKRILKELNTAVEA